MKIVRKNKKYSKKIIIIIVSILVILCVIGFFVFFAMQKSSDKSSTTSQSISNTTNTSSSPTTTGVDKTNDTSPVNSASKVNLIIVDASKYDNIFEVRAYAADVVENGTCTFAFTSGTNTVTKTSAATAGSNTTSCATMDVAISGLSASNNWTLKLTYTSTSGSYSGETSKDIQL